MLPLLLMLRRQSGDARGGRTSRCGGRRQRQALGLNPDVLFALLCIAGIACCVAMSMPQVHIVAYCADLGYGVARGAEMLSLMLGFGIISRIASGFVADRIGGLATLLIGSVMQAVALLLYAAVRRPHPALRDLDPVRPVPGRHRADVCHHRARVFPAAAGRHAGRARHHGDHPRHGAGRLDVGRHLRPHGLLLAGVRQRLPVEPAQHRHRALPAAAALDAGAAIQARVRGRGAATRG